MLRESCHLTSPVAAEKLEASSELLRRPGNTHAADVADKSSDSFHTRRIDPYRLFPYPAYYQGEKFTFVAAIQKVFS
jgi:hypothetical protein